MKTILLRQIYALVAATPEALIDLDRYQGKNGTGCVLGLMSRNGMFGITFVDGSMKAAGAQEEETAWMTVARGLGIKASELIDIAGTRGHSFYDPGAPDGLSDKALVLYRIEHLFRDHGEDLMVGSRAFKQYLNSLNGAEAR